MTRRSRVLCWSVAAVAALLTAVVLIYAANRTTTPASPLEKLVLAVPTQPAVANVWFAHAQGYFREEGLDVTLQPHATGRQALAATMEGKADVAVAADTPIVFASLQRQPIAILATIYQSSLYSAVAARKDRGIREIADLKGKRIGVAFGTSADLFLDTLLATHGMVRTDVARVNVGPDGVLDALVKGEVDAVSTWIPHTNQIRAKFGDAALIFNDQAIYTLTFNMVSMRATAQQRPDTVKRLLKAMIKSEEYIKSHPREALTTAARALAMEPALVIEVINPQDFTVNLTQSLLVTLEDHARWAIKHELSDAKQVPNYLEFLFPDSLAALKPRAVTVIR